METINLIIGTDNYPIVIAGAVFMAIGVVLISLIKANFIWYNFIYKTRWAKSVVGFVCAAIIMRFLQQYQQIASEETLLFIAFGLGVGSDLCIRAIMYLPKLPIFSFLNKKE